MMDTYNTREGTLRRLFVELIFPQFRLTELTMLHWSITNWIIDEQVHRAARKCKRRQAKK